MRADTGTPPEMDKVAGIRAALVGRPDRGSTHWDGCEVERNHRDCAIGILLDQLDTARQQRADLLAALKAMVASYDGIRDGLTSPIVLGKLAAADAAILNAEGR